VIEVGKKGKRYSPRFQFQVVLEVLRGEREGNVLHRLLLLATKLEMSDTLEVTVVNNH